MEPTYTLILHLRTRPTYREEVDKKEAEEIGKKKMDHEAGQSLCCIVFLNSVSVARPQKVFQEGRRGGVRVGGVLC